MLTKYISCCRIDIFFFFWTIVYRERFLLSLSDELNWSETRVLHFSRETQFRDIKYQVLFSAFVEILSEYRSRILSAVIHPRKVHGPRENWRAAGSTRGWNHNYIGQLIYIYTFIYLDDNRTLKWDTMRMKLYCSPESVGQFDPSADRAIVCHEYHHQMHWHRLQEFLGECIHSNLLC